MSLSKVYIQLECLWISALVATINVSAQQTLTNIDYLGLGYDVLLGNPHADLRDPGFLDPVIALEYNENAMTSDGRWRIPDKTLVQRTVSCTYQSETTEAHGTSAYRNVLSTDASVSGEGWGARFSANAAFREVRNGTSAYRKSYVTSVARCLLYRATIRRMARIKVTPDFIYAVGMLPINVDSERAIDETYLEFISAFGTHYATAVDMGAKAVLRSEFDQASWMRFSQLNVDVRTAASASFLIFNSAMSAASSHQRELAETYDGQRTSLKASYVGSRPPTDGRWETWAQSTGDSPYPIKYDLRPLTDLLTPRYFTDMNESELTAKRNILNASYAAYCHSLPGCGLPQPDRIPVRMDRVEIAFRGVHRVSCQSGYSLLSCGIDNIPGSAWEAFRKAIPVSATTCECYDYFGAKCVAWCTNSVQGFEIVASHRHTGQYTVGCPSGKKVIGCHLEPHANEAERWRSHFPTSNGNGCTCYDYFGSRCYATCAADIRNHEVVSQYTRGVATVRCSPGNIVLGCGIGTGDSSDGERWRFFHIAPSKDACQCYDFFGATCYATCGKFD